MNKMVRIIELAALITMMLIPIVNMVQGTAVGLKWTTRVTMHCFEHTTSTASVTWNPGGPTVTLSCPTGVGGMGFFDTYTSVTINSWTVTPAGPGCPLGTYTVSYRLGCTPGDNQANHLATLAIVFQGSPPG